MAITVVQRKPSVEEFQSIVASVSFRAHDKAAVEIALRNTIFSVCAMEEQYIVGLGRIVGDGAISFLLTNIIVRPSHQRRGIGSLIVKRLCSCIEALPYKNIVLEVVPLPGSVSFYDVSPSKLHEMPAWDGKVVRYERAAHS
jgi:ribosomal protein S18 acetylase RimI-like enzyme